MIDRGSYAMWLAGLVGCASPPDIIPLTELPPDSLTVAVAVSADGEIHAANLIGPNASDGIFLTLPQSTGLLFLFHAPAADFIDTAGEIFDFSSLTARPNDMPADRPGSCGRCPIEVDLPPQVIVPGSACAPPSWSSVDSYRIEDRELIREDRAEAGEQLRRRIALDWPGDCPCSAEPPGKLELTNRCYLPPSMPETFSAPATDEWGNVSSLTSEDTILIAPRSGTPQFIADDLGVLGRAVSSTRLSTSAETVVFVTSSAGDEKLTFDLVTVDGSAVQSRTRVTLNEPIRAQTIQSDGTGRVWIAASRLISGAGSNRIPIILNCAVTPSDVDCVEHLSDPCPFDENYLQDFLVRPDGQVIGLGSRPSLYVLAPGEDRLSCEQTDPFSGHSLDGVSYELDRRVRNPGRITQLGDRLFVCVGVNHVDNKGPTGYSSAVFTMSVDDVTSGEPPELIWVTPGGSQCVGSFIEDRPNLLLSFGNRAAIEVDDTGRVVQSYDRIGGPSGVGGEFSELPDSVSYVTSTGDFQLAQLARNVLFRRERGGNFELIHGMGPFESLGVRVFEPLSSTDRFVWFNERDGGRIVEPPTAQCSGGAIGAPLDLDGWVPNTQDRMFVSAVDSRGPDQIVVTGATGSNAWLRRVDVGARAVIEEIELPIRGREISDLAELMPGSFIAIDSAGDILWIHETAVDTLSVDYDDPKTEEIEEAPLPTGHRPPFSAVDARNGVAWVGGDNRLARIVVGRKGEDPRVQGYWLERVLSPELREAPYDLEWAGLPEITAVSAQCPDRVSIGLRQVIRLGFDEVGEQQGALASLAPGDSFNCNPGSKELALCIREVDQGGETSGDETVRPRVIAILSEGRKPVFQGGRRETASIIGAAESGRTLMFGGPLGRIWFQSVTD